MSAISGTNLLLYSDGQVIAMQRGMSITVDQDLPDATSKDSAGWARHINGLLNAKIDFTGLFSTLTTAEGGMEANALMDYIINRKNLLISILGLSFPIVGEVSMNSLQFDAPQEGAMTLSGSLKVNGQLYCLRGTMGNLVSDPDGTSNTYDTMTISGTAITSAINAAGAADVRSNTFGTTAQDVIKLAVLLTKTSGELPSVTILGSDDSPKTAILPLVEGFQVVTLTVSALATATGSLYITNTAAANWSLSSIYLFRVSG